MEKLPNVAVESYRAFVQKDLASTFDDTFPVWFQQGAMLDCHDVRLESPDHDIDLCKLWRKTYSAPITGDVTFAVFDPDGDEDDEPTSTVTERLVVGEIPVILDDGSFLVNGLPVVLVPMLDRSPGILREREVDEDDPTKATYHVKIIPESGPWVSLSNSPPDPIIWAKVHQSKKLVPVATLLRALGMDDEDMFQFAEELHGVDRFRVARSRLGGKTGLFRKAQSGKWRQTEHAMIAGRVLAQDVQDAPAGSVLVPSDVGKFAEELGPGESLPLEVLGRSDISFAATCAADQSDTKKEARALLSELIAASETGGQSRGFEARMEQYSLSRTGRKQMHHHTGEKLPDRLVARTVQTAVRQLVGFVQGDGGSFEDDTYSLENRRMVTVGDMLARTLRYGIGGWHDEVANLVRQTVRNAKKPGRKKADDEKPKSLDELMPDRVTNRKHITSAMRRLFPREKAQWLDHMNPVASVMDRSKVMIEAGQTKIGAAAKAARWVNSSHFRRLSVAETGEGENIGLANYLTLYARPDRDGFIRVPAYVVDEGVVTDEVDWLTPHTEAKAVMAYTDNELSDDWELVGSPTIRAEVIPGAVDDKGDVQYRKWMENLVEARVYRAGTYETVYVKPEQVTHFGVAADDSLAPAGALIPFIDHDDSTRIGMASKMMQQAVPCIRNERALVTTGRENQIAKLCGGTAMVTARNSGTVVKADSRTVVVDGSGPGTGVEYHRLAGDRVSHGSMPRHRLRVRAGDTVEAGDVLADGAATVNGELSLGQNLKVAFMTWRGYNFEDAVVISERVAADNKLTSLHMQQFTCKISKTPLGPEETTDVNIPDVSESDLANLDGDGLVRVGTVVKERDILVGKVTPKDPKELTSEEKLIKMLFDKNYGGVKDSSLRMPPGYDGAVVVDVQVVTPRQTDQDGNDETPEPTANETAYAEEFKGEMQDRLDTERRLVRRKLTALAVGKRVKSMPGAKRGGKLGRKWLEKLPMSRWGEIEFSDPEVSAEFASRLGALREMYDTARSSLSKRVKGPEDRAGGSGVLRRVVVTLAYKRRIQMGDKLAGRHGNKGVISRVVPEEDMPFDPETGEPVDLVLNPLGVPSRMNIGQILETHLGLALGEIGGKLERIRESGKARRDRSEKALHGLAKAMDWRGLDLSSPRAMSDDIAENGITMNSQPFDGVAEDDVKRLLRLARLPENGQKTLADGITGEKFDRPCTVGTVYIYKLRHMVDDKMHARARGRYMTRTNQPVRGRSQHGGQRMGEMEVHALMAYGASANLLEMTTIKSDDVRGRTRLEKAIIANEAINDMNKMAGSNEPEELRAGVSMSEILPDLVGKPDALGLFLHEVRALGLDVHLEKDGEEVDQVGPRRSSKLTIDDVFMSDDEIKARHEAEGD